MGDLQTDLLAYDDIELEVDRLFKGFLDASLMSFAASFPLNITSYWKAVVEFRCRTLALVEETAHAFFGPDEEKTCSSLIDKLKKLEKTTTGPSGETENFDVIQFLYWFDVRADYWSTGGDPALLNALVPADQLASIYEQAKALKNRIDAIEALRNKMNLAQGRDPASYGRTVGGPPQSGDSSTSARGHRSLLNLVISRVHTHRS